MFNAKLNYLVCGFALAFLILLGRFFYMQVVRYDAYAQSAEDVMLRKELLPPARALIISGDGKVVAHSETVWDVYIDWQAFAAPQSYAMRHRGEPDAEEESIADRVRAVEKAGLPAPSSRRRFFLYWKLREDEQCRRDFVRCLSQLSTMTRIPEAELAEKFALVSREVEALLEECGDPASAKPAAISAAWARAGAALSDPEYWSRIRRYPKSVELAPVLAARLDWSRREAEYLSVLLERAGGSKSVFAQAARNCDAKSRELALNEEAAQSLEIAEREEFAAWRRLFSACSSGVHEGRGAIEKALASSVRRATQLEERLLKLKRDIIERYRADYERRWHEYEFEENPLLLMREAPRDVVELLKLNADVLPGLVCKLRPSRTYEYAQYLAPVIGGVALPDSERVEEIMAREEFSAGLAGFIENWCGGDEGAFFRFADGVVAQQSVGAFGVERAFDSRLAGAFGARVSIHDARGRVRAIEFEQAPQTAPPLGLTIDLELTRDILENVAAWEQKLAAKARKKSLDMFLKGHIPGNRWANQKWSLRGAAVVLDVKTGAVLALASFPTYDPARMAGGSEEDREYRRQLAAEAEADELVPYWARHTRQLNRASGASYHPGSTWKALTSIALLEEGLTTADKFDEVSNVIEIAGVKLKTGHPAGPNLDIRDALERSSNGFFYYYSQRLSPEGANEDWEAMRYWAATLGVGEDSGFELGCRRANIGEIGRVGQAEVSTMAIGQGRILMTPLELTRLYAAIASRKLPSLHISGESRTFPQDLEVSEETWNIVHEGLRRVVYGGHGTARQSQIGSSVLKEIRCAGKTGTAENGKGVPDHAWFAGFAPHDKPEVAFVMLAEYSDLYGADISPVIGECIKRYLVRRGILPAGVASRERK